MYDAINSVVRVQAPSKMIVFIWCMLMIVISHRKSVSETFIFRDKKKERSERELSSLNLSDQSSPSYQLVVVVGPQGVLCYAMCWLTVPWRPIYLPRFLVASGKLPSAENCHRTSFSGERRSERCLKDPPSERSVAISCTYNSTAASPLDTVHKSEAHT